MESDSDIKRLLLKKTTKDRVCDSCGITIPKDTYYYNRPTPPGIYCKSCREFHVNRWGMNRKNYDKIMPQIASILNERGFITYEILKTEFDFDENTYVRLLGKLDDMGYVVKKTWDKSEKWMLIYTPILQNFLDSLQFHIDNPETSSIQDIMDEYGTVLNTLSYLLSNFLNDDYHDILGINSTYISKYQYLETICREYELNKVSNTLYLERISFDDKVYAEVTRDNRDLVMTYFIECLFNLSSVVILKEYGSFIKNNQELMFSVITEESFIGMDSGCDIDIIVMADDISCMINDGSEDICDLLEYLNLTDDENAKQIIKMMMDLIGCGF